MYNLSEALDYMGNLEVSSSNEPGDKDNKKLVASFLSLYLFHVSIIEIA